MEIAIIEAPEDLKPDRKVAPNPFTEHMPVPDGKCLTMTATDTDEAGKITRQARRAATDAGVSLRVKTVTAENGATTLTLWTVAKRERPANAPKLGRPKKNT